MIQTTVRDMDAYDAMHPRFAKAFKAMKELARQPFVEGRHEVDGDEIFVLSCAYATKPVQQKRMEAHRRYIDVMMMLEGEERIGVFPADDLHAVTDPYDEKAEALFAAMEPLRSELYLRPGDVVVLFPKDAHAPGICVDAPAPVKKLIGKVAVD